MNITTALIEKQNEFLKAITRFNATALGKARTKWLDASNKTRLAEIALEKCQETERELREAKLRIEAEHPEQLALKDQVTTLCNELQAMRRDAEVITATTIQPIFQAAA